MATEIDFNTAAATAAALQTTSAVVWTKATWSDPWTLRPELLCTEARWAAFPEIDSATFRRYWGQVMLPGESAMTAYARIDLRGQFVLVRINTADAPRWWLGYIDSQRPSPVDAGGASGDETLHAYGLGRALQVTPIAETVFNKAGAPVRVKMPVDFNRDGRPNRTTAPISGCHLFESDPAATQYWSSRDVVTYLLTHALPTPAGTAAGIPWAVADAALIPDWDVVRIETRGRSVWDVLAEVITERHMLGATVEFSVDATDPDAVVTTLVFRPYSLAPAELTVGSRTFPASTRLINWDFDSDPLTACSVSESSLDAYDQTIIRGDRHTTVCTLSVARTELQKGWEDADETEYEAGASGSDGYGVLSWSGKRVRDQSVRSGFQFEDVYTRLVIPAAWNRQASGQPVFVDSTGAPVELYVPTMEILPELPLHPGEDYSGDLSAVTIRAGSQPIKVICTKPKDAGKYIDAVALADCSYLVGIADRGGNYKVSARGEGEALRLRVDGAPQHAVAPEDFAPLTADNLQTGKLDYATAEYTLALRDDRYVEAAYPVELAASADVVRRRVLYAGDQYRCIRIVPDTIVDIDAVGDLVRATGGYLIDDTERLQSLAQLYHAWHGGPHRTLDVTTQRVIGSIVVGDVIGSVGLSADGPINAAVTSVEITLPIGERADAPSLRIVTASHRADPFAGLLTA